MKILLCEPGKHPVATEIPNTLEDMQKVVGGMIQAVYPWEEPVALVCDDEGLLKQYPFNRQINEHFSIVGTFFLCGINGEHFDDLPSGLMLRFARELYDPHMRVKTPMGIMVLPMEVDEGD